MKEKIYASMQLKKERKMTKIKERGKEREKESKRKR